MSQEDIHYAYSPRFLWLPKIVYWHSGANESVSLSGYADTVGLRYIMFNLDWHGHAPTGAELQLNCANEASDGSMLITPDAIFGDCTTSAGVVYPANQSNGHLRVIWERPTRFVSFSFTAGDLTSQSSGNEAWGTLYGTP